MSGLQEFNRLPREDASDRLLKCCGSTRWAEGVAGARPFESFEALLETADRVWWSLGREDWLEAFRSHPKIGERRAERETGEGATRWSEQEQSGTRGASAEVMSELAEANREYEERFGHIFIVCATGKSADEMLSLLRARLPNDADTELRVAAEEQRRITHLRLEKSLGSAV
ncbi:MAG TPA: 2-oxo-4-hydroxy-4-carboxy-5-ureidoimidazoline decarboxylase [Pyrinomonadaceae bacterium]|nr:2-oxo-4-hydroxy-4-carboxy-5-ureidoimidazoline decarboxylase [Pyrinomonadaceae bacterium]